MWLQEEENIMKSSKVKRAICLIVGALVSLSTLIFMAELTIDMQVLDLTNTMVRLTVGSGWLVATVAGVVGVYLLLLGDKCSDEQRKEEEMS